MKTLRYTQDDAWRWAAFSGDHNPIHFNKQWVRERGGERLSVHGMRALLDVKQSISHEINPIPFVKCTVRLRQPLWCDQPYQLLPSKTKNNAASVVSAENEHTCFTCQLTPVEQLPPASASSVYTLSTQEHTRLQQAFAPLLPHVQEWHFLDALLFRHLLHDRALLRQEAIAALLPTDATLEDIFSRYPVVQTHQEIHFSAPLFAQWSAHAPVHEMTIQTLPALVVGNMTESVVIRVAASTLYQNNAMTNAITLKIGPTAPSLPQ